MYGRAHSVNSGHADAIHRLTLMPDSSWTSGRLVSGRICCRFLVSNDWMNTGCTPQTRDQISQRFSAEQGLNL